MKKNLLISFSGGRTSAYMTWWLLNVWKDRHLYNIIVCFANTGKEREETLQFVKQCDEAFGFNTVWLEAVVSPVVGEGVRFKVVTYETAARDGEPFWATIEKYGVPNTNAPGCSKNLKRYPIHFYARSIGFDDYYTAIGIRADEPARLNWNKVKNDRILYPFAQFIRVTKSDVNLWWSKQAFDLRLKSYEGNCDLCWKKSNRVLMTILAQEPGRADWWRKVENTLGTVRPYGVTNEREIKLPMTFYRGDTTIDELIEDSKMPFKPAKDESKKIDQYKQVSLFDLSDEALWDAELDSTDGCQDSCEPF